MKLKKILSLLVAMTMLFSCVGITAMAEESAAVAKIGETTYASLADAINDADAGQTVTLVKDILGDGKSLTISKDITLDLGGYTFTDAYIITSANVTIKNGSIKNTNEPYPIKITKNTLTVEDITLEASKSDRAIWVDSGTLNFYDSSILATKGEDNTKSKIYGIWVSKGTTANIYSGSITVDAGPNATAVAIFGNYVNTVNVYDGKISTSGKNYSYAIWTEGDVTVAGGEIVTNEKKYGYSSGITYGYNYAINTKGNVTISGGTITTNGPSGYLVNAGGSNQEITISDVEFTNVLTETDKTAGNHKAPKLINGTSVTVEISGGQFDGVADINPEYVVSGATITVDDKTYIKTEDGLEEKVVAAYIGEQGYETVQAAINAAKKDETVTICAGEYDPINISNKNITIQGTVGDDGELLTTIKGGDPAITGHSFNGTIKDIKIVDAWKVMYAEPAGNVTVDNVYVTGATYGFHLVAYSTGLTWKIENSYMDLAWANSFGVYKDGDADIIIKGNEFVSTNPFYPDYGAIHVNSFLPSVTVEENIFRENARIYIDGSVTDTSKINISKNYHADGVENAFADDADGVTVKINSYYTDVDADGNLSGLVEIVDAVAKVNGVEYPTLAEAAKAAKAGDTITMIDDATLAGEVTLPAEITFNGNGKTITLEAGAVLTFNDGTVINGASVKDGGSTATASVKYYGTINFHGTNEMIPSDTSGVGGPFHLVVNEDATLLINRFVLGYDRKITVKGTIEDAHSFDPTGKTPSLKFNSTSGVSVGGTGTGDLIVENAYVELDSSTWKSSYATHTWSFKNSYVSATSFGSNNPPGSEAAAWNVTFDDSVVAAKNYIKAAKNVTYSLINGSVANTNSLLVAGTLNIDEASSLTAKAQQNNSVGVQDGHGDIAGTINVKGNLNIDGSNIQTFELLGGTVNVDGGVMTTGKMGLNLTEGSVLKVSADGSFTTNKVIGTGAIEIDAADMTVGNVSTITADVTDFIGTINVINNDELEVEVVDGKLTLIEKPKAFVASVTDAEGNVKSYATLEEAFKAATDGCTIEILDDVVIDYKWDCRDYATNGSHSQFKESVTINGNNHTIKFTNTINDGNWNTVFRFEENAIVKDLTIDISGATGTQRVITAKKSLDVDNLTIIGSAKYGIIFGEGATVAELANAEISIANSNLNGTRRAISDNEGGKDVKSITITGNVLNANAYVSAFDSITFTGNTVTNGYVDLRSYTTDNSLNVTATDNTLTANVDDKNRNYIKAGGTVDAQKEFVIYVDPVAEVNGVKYGTLQEAIDAANAGEIVTLLADVNESVTIAEGKVVELDLAGFDIVGEMCAIKNEGTLTINDSVGTGNVYTTNVDAQGRPAIENIGTVNINGGWFGDSNNDTTDRNAINRGNAIKNYGVAVINGGHFTNVSNQYIDANAYAYAINTLSGGTTTINNAVVYGDVNGLIYSDGKTIVNDGSFTLGRPNEENNLWYLAYGDVEIKGGTWTRAFKVPSWNTGNPTVTGAVKISGGLFNVTIADTYIVENYAAIMNFDGNYVVGKAPTATVTNEGAVVVPGKGYTVYNNFGNSTSSSNDADMPLPFVMQYVANESAEEGAASPYAEWYGDFVISITGLSNGEFSGAGCYLAGHYGSFGWVKVPIDSLTIEEGVRYPIMLSTIGNGQKYEYICGGVDTFKCALYLTPEVLAANPDLNVSLELCVVDNSAGGTAAQEALATTNSPYTYQSAVKTFEDDEFVVEYVATIGEKNFTTLEDAIIAANAGDTIVLLDDVTEDVTINKSITLDGADKKYTGKINVSGKVNVTIQNVNFVEGEILHTGNAYGNLIVKDCSFADGGYAVTTASIESVTIEDCSVTNQSLLYAKKSTSEITVKNVNISGGNYVAHIVYGNTAYFENVTATAMTGYGIQTQNYGAKTITLKNCSFETPNYKSIAVRERKEIVDTFVFQGENTMSSLSSSEYAKYVLADADATLKAPEGLNVTTDLEGYVVKYADGKYIMQKVSYVAQIGEEKYETLEDAIAAAQAGDTITVIDDIVLENTVNVPADKTITLDLNGKTITGTPAEAKAYAAINNKGNLTINDTVGTGKILCNHTLAGSTSYAVNTIVNSGTLAVNGGTIENTSTASNQIGYAIDNNSTTGNAVVTVNGGEIKASGSNYYDGIRQFCNSTTLENSVVVNDGSVSSIWMQNPSDGSSDRNTKDVKGSVTVTGGNVMGLYLEPSASFEASVTGGNIGTLSAFETAEGRDLVGFVSGGTFATKPDDAYAAEGYVFEKNADGTWGVTEKEAVELFELRGANVKLGSDLTMFFYIPKAELESGVDYYATITKANVGEKATVVNVQMSEWEDYSDDLYRVAFDDIMAYMMNDKIEVQIFDNDGTAVSDIWTDSISIYAHRIYANQNNKFKTALVDMLNYGAACQKYFGYDAENLANKDLTDEQKNMASVDPPLTDSRVKGDNYYGSSVTCDSTLILQFYFENINETMTAKITYTDAYNEEITETIDGSKFNKRTNTLTGVKVGLAAYDAQQLVKCEVYDGDTLVASAVDSVESYVARMASTDDVYATIMKFALSSKSALTQK